MQICITCGTVSDLCLCKPEDVCLEDAAHCECCNRLTSKDYLDIDNYCTDEECQEDHEAYLEDIKDLE